MNESYSIIGKWVIDPSNKRAKSQYGDISMEFTNDGHLNYIIFAENKYQKINMIYWIEGNILFTDQPSHPQIEKTKFKIADNSKLILDYDGIPAIFIRN